MKNSGNKNGQPNLLQRFALLYGLKTDGHSITGPNGEIYLAYAGWMYRRNPKPYQKFNPITEAQLAVESIGLKYTGPKLELPTKTHVIRKHQDWYIVDKATKANVAGPFNTRALARIAKKLLSYADDGAPKQNT